MEILAVVRFRFSGMHAWRNADERYSYLRNLHRHEFHVELAVIQKHDDRDVEFISLKNELQGYVQEQYMNEYERVAYLSGKSCEQLATELIDYCLSRGLRVAYCSVFEDGENGATVRI